MFSQSITSNKEETGEVYVLRPMASLKYKQLVCTFRYLKIRNRYTGWAKSRYTVIIYCILYTYFWPKAGIQ